MRFAVGRDALGEAVAFVSRALPSRPVIPLLSGLMLRAGADGLVLSCFDYEVSARMRVDAEVAEPGAALVPGRLLAEITKSLPARPAEFCDQGEIVRLTCGRAEFELVRLAAEEYPALPGSPPPAGTVNGGMLAAAIGQVAPAASRDDTLPMLTAVCLDVSGESLTLAATDRYRLAVRELPFDPAEPGMRAVALVPARFLADSVRMLTPKAPVTVAFSGERGGRAGADPRPAEGVICLECGDRRLTARLIAGEFIRYRTRFPEEFGCRADVPAGPFIDAVRRAALVADRAGPVRLSFSPSRLVIEAHDEGRARAAETVPADFAGDQPVISFNSQYLLDGLTAAAAQGAAGAQGDAGARGLAGGGAGRDGGAAGDGDGGAGGDDGASPDGAGATGRAGPATGGTAGDEEAPGPGLIRLEFTSPARPALVTWAAPGGPGAGQSGSAAAGQAPAFRYLVVPLRLPSRA